MPGSLEFTTTEQDGRVAVVTFTNPPLNQLSWELLEELGAELERLDRDDEVRAIVIRGGGERAFAAGADIKQFPPLYEAAVRGDAVPRGLHELGRRMDALRTPLVAAIRGFCLGGGLELAMCCDVRVCADDARLGQPEVKLGLIPGGGGTQRLPRLVGPGRALLLNLGGEPIDARTAYEWGLVEKVVPPEQLLDAALEIAGSFAARSPVALGVLRELARTTRSLPIEDGLPLEAEGFVRCLTSEDGREGVAAFIEKREPLFTGR